MQEWGVLRPLDGALPTSAREERSVRALRGTERRCELLKRLDQLRAR